VTLHLRLRIHLREKEAVAEDPDGGADGLRCSGRALCITGRWRPRVSVGDCRGGGRGDQIQGVEGAQRAAGHHQTYGWSTGRRRVGPEGVGC
jgi:hypothetical protein